MPKPLPDEKPGTLNIEDRMMRIKPEVNQRLDKFIEGNPKMADYYRDLIKETPDRAMRMFMLSRMYRHEVQMRVDQQQAPQARQWLDQQGDALKQWIMDRLAKINPFYREKAEVAKEKPRLDFSPKAPNGLSIS